MIDAAAGPHLFISAAEPSADLHGAALIEAVKTLHPDARFTGVAGPRMRRAGCNSIYDMTKHSSMLTAVFGQVHHAYRMLSTARKTLATQRFDGSVVIDAPTLNLPVARQARRRGIPSLYYIAPQTWAWGEWARIPRVRQAVDRIACIWPFEEPYFRSHGLTSDYVGHPLFARLQAKPADPDRVRALRIGGKPILTIMPGSRKQEIDQNFRHQLRVAAIVKSHHRHLRVLVSVANARVKRLLRNHLQGAATQVELHERSNPELFEAADACLVVSGTIALEAAFYGAPMIVMYNSSRVLYQLVRGLMQTPFLAMPNILAGREVVPEFMPYYRSPEPIAARALELFAKPELRQQMSEELGRLVKPFLDTTASVNAARMLLEMAGVRTSPRPLPGEMPAPIHTVPVAPGPLAVPTRHGSART